MVPRIPHHGLLRLAQRQGTASSLLTTARYLQTTPFSTSQHRRQHPRHPPAADPTTTTTTLPPSPNSSQTPPKTEKERSILRRLLLPLTFTILGIAAGTSLRVLLVPPDPPTPGTEADAIATRLIHTLAAKLPVVQRLDAAAAADPEAWESWDAYDSLSAAHRAQHITAGALAGYRGVGGYQRVWWNKREGEVVSVVFFGTSTAGWPGVVHGGCLATILDESCGRVAFKEWGGRPGVTASLGLEYKMKTLTNAFYVITARVRREEELPEKERGKRHYKCWVDATIKDAYKEQVNVVAEALFVGGQGKNGNGGVVGEGKVSGKHARF